MFALRSNYGLKLNQHSITLAKIVWVHNREGFGPRFRFKPGKIQIKFSLNDAIPQRRRSQLAAVYMEKDVKGSVKNDKRSYTEPLAQAAEGIAENCARLPRS